MYREEAMLVLNCGVACAMRGAGRRRIFADRVAPAAAARWALRTVRAGLLVVTRRPTFALKSRSSVNVKFGNLMVILLSTDGDGSGALGRVRASGQWRSPASGRRGVGARGARGNSHLASR